MNKVKVSLILSCAVLILVCTFVLNIFASQSVLAAPSWHSLMIRSAWERDNQEMGGDGTQIPRCMVWSPKNNYQTVFFGVDTAGIYRSDDGGETWNIKMKGLLVTYVKSMAVDPVNPDVVYALGSQFSYVPNAGLYMSTDNGENWSLHQKFFIDSAPSNAHAIAIDSTTYDTTLGRCKTMYVGTSSGLYKTTDGGLNWSDIGNTSIGDSVISSITVHPTDHNLILVGTYIGVFRSIDGGSNFENISSGLPTYDNVAQVAVDSRISALACDPNVADRMYATFEDPLGKTPRLFKKTGNLPWQEIGTVDLPGSGIYYDVIVHPAAPNKLLLGVFNVTGLGARYYSEDYGATWSKRENKVIENRFNLEASSFAHRIRNFTAFAPHPTDSNVWLSGLNFGAIYKTTDSCKSWVWSSNNYSGAAMLKFSFNPNDPRHMYFGGFDLGGLVSYDEGQSFIHSTADKHGKVDVMGSAIDPDAQAPETATVYASIGNNNAYTTGQLEISTNGGKDFKDVPGTFGTQDTEVFYHNVNHQYIYAGDYVSKDHGVSWQNVYDNIIYTENFESTVSGMLPANWLSAIPANDQSTVAVNNDTVNKRLKFSVKQDTPLNRTPSAIYEGKAFDFTETPLIGEATLYPGTTVGTMQTLRLTNEAGSYVDVMAETNVDGTMKTKYRVVDLQNFDTGEVTIADNLNSTFAAVSVILAPNYYKIVLTDENKVAHVRTIYKDFNNTTGYKLQIISQSTSTTPDIVSYADNIKFWKTPIQIFSADPINPETVYAYDGVTLYRSTNCGANWNRLITFNYDDNSNNYLQWQNKAAALDKLGEYIFIGNRNGIYRYNIASNTYTVKSYNDGFLVNNDGECQIRRVRTDPTNENIVYAGEVNGGGVGLWVFKSTDRGETWEQMPQDGLDGIKRVLSMDLDYKGRLWVGSYHGTYWYGETIMPETPTGLTATENNGSITLNWTASANAATYQVKRSTNPGGPYKVVQGGVVGTSYVDTTAASGIKNYYVVSAGNLSGESAPSSEVSVLVPVRIIYGNDFTYADGQIPPGWTNIGTTGNVALVKENKLTHTQSSNWAESVARYTQRAFDFSDGQLTVKATLDAGASASSISLLRLRDSSKQNYIVVNQIGDKRISIEIKDGTYSIKEYFGPFDYTENTVTLEVTANGVRVYKDDTLLKNIERTWENKSDYYIELAAKTGNIGDGVKRTSDNLEVWDVRLFPMLINVSTPAAITAVNGTAKTAEALNLPETVTLETESGNVTASVAWDVATAQYDPTSREEQTFTVTGTVTLPSRVKNLKNIPLTIGIQVTVSEGTAITDKTALAAKIAEAKVLNSASYTQESWTAMQSALATAEAANDKVDATQTEVDEALSGLDAAIQGLVCMIYGNDFTYTDGQLPQGWTNIGTAGNVALVENNKLTHTQSTAWAESVARYTQQAFDFTNGQLTVKATLDAGASPSAISLLRLRDSSKQNYIVVNQISDKKISIEIKDGTYVFPKEYFGPFDSTENTVTLEVTANGVRVYKDDTLLKNIERTWENKTNYYIEFAAKTGTVGNGIKMTSDNLEVWDVRLFPMLVNVATPAAITAVNGTAKTAEALNLPETVTLETESGNVTASVAWDVAAAVYDPASKAEQNFIVNGTVTLPNRVKNLKNIPLTIGIQVTVSEGTVITDKTVLAAKIAEAKSLNQANYTQESWTAMQSALAIAEAANDKADATQVEVDEALSVLEIAIQELVTAPVSAADKTLLAAKIAEAKALNPASYTQVSWTAMQSALATAKAANDKAEATQAEVDEAFSGLDAAIQGLVTAPVSADKTLLAARIAEAKAFNQASCTPESWTAMLSALAIAEAVNGKSDATQAEVDAALSGLDAAIQELVAAPVSANKTSLAAKIAEAKTLNQASYTQESWTAMQSALATAEAANDKTDATQAEVDAAFSSLGTAIQGLVTAPISANKTELAARIAEAKALDQASYTQESWTVIQSALAIAEAANDKADATQAEVDAALSTLETAIQGLVTAPVSANKTELAARIAEAKALNQASYTQESWTAMQSALATAEAANDKVDATQAEVDAACNVLTTAINGLATVTTPTPTPTPTPAPTYETTVSGNQVTTITTIKAETKPDGTAIAAIPGTQLTDAIAKAMTEAAKQSGETETVIRIEVSATADAKTVGVDLTGDALTKFIESKADVLIISTPYGTMTFDEKTALSISRQAAGTVTITAEKVEPSELSAELQQKVGDRPVVSFDITSKGNTISKFNGNATVTLPYSLKAGENPNAIIVYYINTTGKLETVRNCKYDPAAGTITFKTPHFSKYAVGHNKAEFNDVADNVWYSDAVTFAAAREITGGVGNGNFGSEEDVTSAQCLVMIMKAFGINPDENAENNFSDAGNTYYTGYLAAAKRLGITSGLGNNMFAPEKQVSRQEMFVLAYNVLKSINELPTGDISVELKDFKDAGQVSAYANDAITLFVKSGIISGTNGNIFPENKASRAQFIQILYNIMK